MKSPLLDLISSLFCAVTLIGCASGSIPDTATAQPATQVPATSTITTTVTAVPSPTIAILPTFSLATAPPSVGALPTFSFGNPVTSAPTIAVESPFEFVATLDEILPSTDDRAYFRSASDGSVWMFTNRGIARLSNSDWTVYVSNYEGYLVGIDTLGRAWFISSTIHIPTEGGASSSTMGSISAWDGTKWTKYSKEEGWTGFYMEDFRPSMAELNGQIWISAQLDLRVFDGSRWKVIKPEEIGLRSPLSLSVHSFVGAEEVWVTGCYFNTPQPHGSDITWYDGSTWQRKSMPEEGGCLSTAVEHQGHVWMATHDSLWEYARATKEWTHYALTQPVSSHIISLAFNESGEPWFISLACYSQRGCTGSTLYHLQNEIWIPISPANPGTAFYGLLIDSADRVWVSARDGVYQIVNDQPNLVSHLIVSSWTMDRTGKIWVIGRDPSTDHKLSLWVTNP